jgi:hypothetical protein
MGFEKALVERLNSTMKIAKKERILCRLNLEHRKGVV